MKYLKALIRRALIKIQGRKVYRGPAHSLLSDPSHSAWPSWLAPRSSDHRISRKNSRILREAMGWEARHGEIERRAERDRQWRMLSMEEKIHAFETALKRTA